jgi:hypothetical protein
MIYDEFYTPPYPDLGARVAKLRQNGDRQTHGAAVLEAVRKLQRKELHQKNPRRERPVKAVRA